LEQTSQNLLKTLELTPPISTEERGGGGGGESSATGGGGVGGVNSSDGGGGGGNGVGGVSGGVGAGSGGVGVGAGVSGGGESGEKREKDKLGHSSSSSSDSPANALKPSTKRPLLDGTGFQTFVHMFYLATTITTSMLKGHLLVPDMPSVVKCDACATRMLLAYPVITHLTNSLKKKFFFFFFYFIYFYFFFLFIFFFCIYFDS
jgi:hypothetical protein